MPTTLRKNSKPSFIQSVVFDRSKWTLSKAKAWLKHHGFYYDAIDVKPTQIRARQFDPDKKHTYRTIVISSAIKAIYARKKKITISI